MKYRQKMFRSFAIRGFTLVELAIVLTIIGLLIGAVLKGQELIDTARVTSTISDVGAIRAAAAGFKDQYGYYPGDLPRASQRIPGCTAACDGYNPDYAPEHGTGDGIIGYSQWSVTGWQNQVNADGTPLTDSGGAYGMETQLFWAQLALTGMLGNVSPDILNGNPLEWGVTNSRAAVGNGFIVGHNFITPVLGAAGIYTGDAPVMDEDGNVISATGSAVPIGMIIGVTGSPGGCLNDTATVTPHIAATIDRKVDDGVPLTGSVLATACGINHYNESSRAKNCNVIFADSSMVTPNSGGFSSGCAK